MQLPLGTVLVVGGQNPYSAPNAEIYNPATNTWRAAAEPLVPRIGHDATLLPDGTVIVADGNHPGVTGSAPLGFSEIYHSESDVWTVGPYRDSFGVDVSSALTSRHLVVGGGAWVGITA